VEAWALRLRSNYPAVITWISFEAAAPIVWAAATGGTRPREAARAPGATRRPATATVTVAARSEETAQILKAWSPEAAAQQTWKARSPEETAQILKARQTTRQPDRMI
jgi:hypothetical protein